MSSHAVFCHDVVCSYGHVVTKASHHDETCAPCSNLANEDVDLVGAFDQNMELFPWEPNAHDFRICMQ